MSSVARKQRRHPERPRAEVGETKAMVGVPIDEYAVLTTCRMLLESKLKAMKAEAGGERGERGMAFISRAELFFLEEGH